MIDQVLNGAIGSGLLLEKNTVAACIVSLVMDGLETSLEEHILALFMMFGKAVCL